MHWLHCVWNLAPTRSSRASATSLEYRFVLVYDCFLTQLIIVAIRSVTNKRLSRVEMNWGTNQHSIITKKGINWFNWIIGVQIKKIVFRLMCKQRDLSVTLQQRNHNIRRKALLWHILLIRQMFMWIPLTLWVD